MSTAVQTRAEKERAARNVRTALILATVALAFGVGFVVRMWLT